MTHFPDFFVFSLHFRRCNIVKRASIWLDLHTELLARWDWNSRCLSCCCCKAETTGKNPFADMFSVFEALSTLLKKESWSGRAEKRNKESWSGRAEKAVSRKCLKLSTSFCDRCAGNRSFKHIVLWEYFLALSPLYTEKASFFPVLPVSFSPRNERRNTSRLRVCVVFVLFLLLCCCWWCRLSLLVSFSLQFVTRIIHSWKRGEGRRSGWVRWDATTRDFCYG